MLDPREIAPDVPRPLSRRDYERMVAIGLFEDESVELLEGMVVRMSPHGPAHGSVIRKLTERLVLALHGRAVVSVQCALAVSDGSEPEPDIAVLPPGDYDDEHPSVAWLVVEVADSSLGKDRGAKSRVYASAGIEEYWIVNLLDRSIEVFRAPEAMSYREVTSNVAGTRIRLLRFPDVELAVEDVLPRT